MVRRSLYSRSSVGRAERFQPYRSQVRVLPGVQDGEERYARSWLHRLVRRVWQLGANDRVEGEVHEGVSRQRLETYEGPRVAMQNLLRQDQVFVAQQEEQRIPNAQVARSNRAGDASRRHADVEARGGCLAGEPVKREDTRTRRLQGDLDIMSYRENAPQDQEEKKPMRSTMKNYVASTVTAGVSCFISLELFSADPVRLAPVRNALMASLVMSVMTFFFYAFSIVEGLDVKDLYEKSFNRYMFFLLTSSSLSPCCFYFFYITSGPISAVLLGLGSLFSSVFLSMLCRILALPSSKGSLPCSRTAITVPPLEPRAASKRPSTAATARVAASFETQTRSSATCAEASLPAT